MATDIALKSFLEEHFDFDSLKKIGFFKDISKADYQAQADRICFYFGFNSIFDWLTREPIRCHVSEIACIFKCPICTCEQQIADSNKITYTMKCVGCKRKLFVQPRGYWDSYYVTEVGGSKEFTVTYSLSKSFVWNGRM